MPRERRCILNVELLEERCVLSTLPQSAVLDDWLGASQWEVESNNTRGLANPVVMTPTPHPLYMTEVYPAFPWHLMDYQNGAIAGTLTQGGDVDYFRFDVSAERGIHLRLMGNTAGVSLELLDRDGNVVASGVGPGYFAREAGTYYARITGAGVSYQLNVYTAREPFNEHEGNHSFAEANPISFLYTWLDAPINLPGIAPPGSITGVPGISGGSLNGHVFGNLAAQPGDVDYFSFLADPHQAIRLSMFGLLQDRGGRITLFDSNHRELASGTERIDWTTAAGGKFYVRIDRPVATEPADAVMTSYRLDVVTRTAPGAVNPVPPPVKLAPPILEVVEPPSFEYVLPPNPVAPPSEVTPPPSPVAPPPEVAPPATVSLDPLVDITALLPLDAVQNVDVFPVAPAPAPQAPAVPPPVESTSPSVAHVEDSGTSSPPTDLSVDELGELRVPLL